LLNGTIFEEIEDLIGGVMGDSFMFAAGAMVTGLIDGRQGRDMLRGGNGTNNWIINAVNAGLLNGKPFEGIEELEGGEGEDTLKGPAEDTTWHITGANAGNVAGVDFSGMENLTGTADNEDTFVFSADGSLSGLLEGGDRGFDSIILENTTGEIIYNFTGLDSGSIERSPTDIITYSGFEPITSTPADPETGTHATVILNYDVSGTITISSPVVGQIRVDHNGTEVVTINNPTTSLTINASDGDDIINIQDLGTFSGIMMRVLPGIDSMLPLTRI
jgi:hypothetical protein